ncbi:MULTISPECIES: hypothetical protein [Actinomycetes]|uniref:Uncharacterized protein n=3 Tax=Amycolatopsis TaxID=1813 RepID=A0A8E2BAG2_9PSEU|nr:MULTISPECIES: hypothetical protein [Actinomycetes]PXY18110.1 hypothetical protein BAY59_34875 [Prauserella coralliicola]AXB46058.1 hypothetical protein A4R43_29230 [Amycolatopsis albispora]MBB2505068.1 hypothetical protein [Amycolatopsis echigonensis]MBF6188760.1 hypothetical protein [Nocardia farcinica]MBF6295834.1 hypothetical protein [Nocardia farcinica]
MISGDGRPDPYQAFQRGRLAVDQHMSKVLQAEDMWAEETATDILLTEAFPDVRYWKFTKRQESAVGADWLWWWIDTTGTSFGLLTQAKILKRRGTGWHVDFGYRRRKTEPAQIDKLLVSSMTFSVPAAHVLYCGTPAYRAGLACGLTHHDGANCRDRERAGVSIVPSIIPHYLMPRVRDNVAVEAFHWSLPLEDVADPGRSQPPLPPLAAVHPDIAEFMRRPQLGARRVAKTMLEAVHSIRMGQFSAALSEDADDGVEDAVFTHLPSDRGHFGVPYLAHVLGGLRHRPPAYVQDLLAGRTPPTWVTDAVAGIVVIHDPEPAIQHLATPAGDGRMHPQRHLAVVHSDDREQLPPAAVARSNSG